MKALSIAFKDVLLTLRDKKALALILAMPLILIAILGSALGPIFSQEANLNQFEVAVIDYDKGEVGDSVQKGLESDELKKILKISKVDENTAREKIQKGEMPAALIIPESFTEDVKAGKNTSLKVLGDPGSNLQSSIFRSIIDKFTTGISSAQIGARTTVETMEQRGLSESQINIQLPQIIGHFSKDINVGLINVQQESVEGRKYISALQYYSAGMGVMFILFTGMFGLKSILEEREKYTLMRIMATDTSRFSIIFGKFLGILFTGFIQVMIMIIITSLAMKVHWGNSYFGIAIMAAATVFGMAGLTMFIASLAKTSRSAEMMGSIGIQVMSLLGGSMIPIGQMPEPLKVLGKATINGWAMSGFTKLMENQAYTSVLMPSVVLTSIGLVCLVLGTWRLRLN